MRQYGVDFRILRSNWRRWNLRRFRRRDLCKVLEQFGFSCELDEFGNLVPPPGDLPLPGLPPSEGGLPKEPLGAAPLPGPVGGIVCPNVLSQQAWITQDGISVAQLVNAGVVLPAPGNVRFFQNGASICEIKRSPDGATVFLRCCNCSGTLQECANTVNVWNNFSQNDLKTAGFG